MSYSFSGIWNSVTGALGSAASWLNNKENANTVNLLGTALMGVGGYFAQKEQAKDQMRFLREKMNLEKQLKSEYSKVPEVDITYDSLTVDESPSLAGGGILTEMQKRTNDKNKRGI